MHVTDLHYDSALRLSTPIDDPHFRSTRNLGDEPGGGVLPAQARDRSLGGENQRGGFVASQGRRRDAEEANLRRENRLLFELVVANAIIASDDHPTLRAGFSEPHDVLSGLWKQLVVDTDLEPSGTKSFWDLLPSQRAIDEEYEGLRRLSPAGARSGPLPRC